MNEVELKFIPETSIHHRHTRHWQKIHVECIIINLIFYNRFSAFGLILLV